jgi:hypothetical protein
LDGVKLDNLVQIGHNVPLVRTAIAGNAGVAGSARIGAHCRSVERQYPGAFDDCGRCGDFSDSVVMRSLTQPGLYTGIFRCNERPMGKERCNLKQLHTLRERIKALEKAWEGRRSTTEIDDGYSRNSQATASPLSFLLVDRVLELERNTRIKAIKNVTFNEPFFTGHFPAARSCPAC